MIVYDFNLNRIFRDGKKLKCMCEPRPAYGETPVVETDAEGVVHYECRILLRLILLALLPKRQNGVEVRDAAGQLQFYDVDKIAVSSHIFEKFDEKQGPIEIVMYENCQKVATFTLDDMIGVVNKLGMKGYKELMLRAENILQKDLQELYTKGGYGRVCPGLDFKYFDDKIPELYDHSPDEGYLQLFKRRNDIALAIEDVKEDIEDLSPDVNSTQEERDRVLADNEIELKVQRARLAELKREFRSLHRTLKKMKPTKEIEDLLDEEIQRYNKLTRDKTQ